MATTVTVAGFYTELESLATGKFVGVTNPKKIRYLNRAIMNTINDMRFRVPGVYELRAAITPASSYRLDLPTDMEISSPFLLYSDSNYVDSSILPSHFYRTEGGKLVFSTEQTTDNLYYIEYTKEPSRYTDTSDTVTETADVRALEILQTEVEHLRDIDLYRGQTSAQAQGSKFRTQELQ